MIRYTGDREGWRNHFLHRVSPKCVIALFSFRLMTDSDFYTRRASRQHLHFLPFFAVPTKILDLIICLSCAFAVVGFSECGLEGDGSPWF
jgi:hypothetical protein